MKRIALIAVLVTYGGCVNADALTLECVFGDNSKSVFILDVTEESAQIVKLEGVEIGTLRMDKHRYDLRFPKTEHSWEKHVRIERYSGSLSREHGQPPFGVFSKDNVFRSGKVREDR